VVDGDPQLVAIPWKSRSCRCARRCRAGSSTIPRRDEIAFDSDRKRFSTLHDTPAGSVLYCKGALEAVLPLCAALEAPAGVTPLAAGDRERFRAAEAAFAHDGMRVLAFA